MPEPTAPSKWEEATCALHQHYKPDLKPKVFSVSGHFEKVTRSTAKSSAPQADDMTRKDQTKQEHESHKDQQRDTFGGARVQEAAPISTGTIVEVAEKSSS